MPFNAELAAGTLSEARFKHYVGAGRALSDRLRPRAHAGRRQGVRSPDRIVQFAQSSGRRDRRRARAARFVLLAAMASPPTGSRAHIAIAGLPPLCSYLARDGVWRSPPRCYWARCCPAFGFTRRSAATSIPAPLCRNPYQGVDRYLCRRGFPHRGPRGCRCHRRSGGGAARQHAGAHALRHLRLRRSSNGCSGIPPTAWNAGRCEIALQRD